MKFPAVSSVNFNYQKNRKENCSKLGNLIRGPVRGGGGVGGSVGYSNI